MSWLETDVYWICDASSWVLCSILTTIVLLFHLLKVYQDIFTKKRKSVSHRKVSPVINQIYVFITISSTATILMYAAALVVGSIGNFYFMSSWCTLIAISLPILWQIAKCGLYLVLLLRLHMIYKDSEYRYRTKSLLFVGITTIIINLIFAIFLSILAYADGHKKYSFTSVAIVCNNIIPESLIYISAAYDVIMSCSCLFAFIYPLKKLIESIPTGSSNADVKVKGNEAVSRHIARLAYIGIKSLVLTMVAVVSTLLMLILVGTTDAFVFTSYDMFINSICIILMTPYYEDKIYYDKLCCCCIQCCKICKYNDMDHKLEIVANKMDASTTSGTHIGSKNDTTSGVGSDGGSNRVLALQKLQSMSSADEMQLS